MAAENECSEFVQNYQTHAAGPNRRLMASEASIIKVRDGNKRYMTSLAELPNKTEIEKLIQFSQGESFKAVCDLSLKRFKSDDEFQETMKKLEAKSKSDILIHLLNAGIFYTPCPTYDYQFEEVSFIANVKAETIRLKVPSTRNVPLSVSRTGIYRAFDDACQRYFTREMEFYNTHVIPELLKRFNKESLFDEMARRFQSILQDLNGSYTGITTAVRDSLSKQITENGQKPFRMCIAKIQKVFATDLYRRRIEPKFEPVYKVRFNNLITDLC